LPIAKIGFPSPLLFVMDCKALLGSLIENIIVDEANPHYFVSADFLMALEGMRLIRYFGSSETVIVIIL
jgi:hypothetical protein